MKLSLAGNKPGLAQNRGKQQSTSKNALGGAPSSKASSSSSKKPLVFGDDDDEDGEEDGMPGSSSTKPLSKLEQKKRSDPSRLAQGLKGLSTTPLDALSSNTAEVTKSNNSKILAKLHAEAKSIDPTIFSYDEVYDTMKSAQAAAIAERKKAKEEEGDTPKYVSGLLKAAELRKKDRIRAEDKLIEREREKEGEDYKDKDAFVTQAYKDQQEELRKMEEEEGLKEEQAAKRPGGMSEYYKRELAQSEAIHEAAMKAASSAASTSNPDATTSTTLPNKEMTEEEKVKAEMTAHGPKSEAAIAAEASKALGRNVTINEEGQIVDKRELLTGGLNIKPKKIYGAASDPNESKKGGFALSIAERKSALEEVKAKENERKQREDEASIGMTGLTMAERQKISRERQSKELERQMLLAQEKKRKAEEEKESELEKKIKVRKNDETKIEEMKRKALERRMQKRKEEDEAKATQAQQ